MRIHHVYADKTYKEKAKREQQKNSTSNIEQILEETPHETTDIWPLTSHLKNHTNETNKLCRTVLEKQWWTHRTFSNRPLHLELPVLANQRQLTNNIYVRTQDAVWKTCQEQWMIGTDGKRERESGKSMLATWLDDDLSLFICIYLYIYLSADLYSYLSIYLCPAYWLNSIIIAFALNNPWRLIYL